MPFICTTMENALANATANIAAWNSENIDAFNDLGITVNNSIWNNSGWFYRLIHRNARKKYLAMSAEKAALNAAEQKAMKINEGQWKSMKINADQ